MTSPDVDSEAMASQCHFIGQSDVDATKCILQKLHHFGAVGRGDRDNVFDKLLIKQTYNISALRCNAADHFGNVAGRKGRIGRIDALWGVSEGKNHGPPEDLILRESARQPLGWSPDTWYFQE